MLKQLSRLEKTRNTILIVFAALLALSLVLFYAPSRNVADANLSRSQETLATVGGDTITVGEIATAQQNEAQRYAQFGSQFTPPPKRILDNEINGRLARIEANRLGFSVSDAEVAGKIRELLTAQGINAGDVEAYRRLITENVGSVEQFERGVRDEIAGEKLRAFLTGGVSVAENEIMDEFKRNETAFELVYVPVTTATLAQNLKPSDDEVKQYFEQNKKNYYISLPQKKIRYLFINQAKVGEKLNIPDADLQAEYDQIPADKKFQGIQGQQIVLKFNEKNEQERLNKANELVTEARKDNGKISEEAFGNLAKGNSQDPRTAQNGGKINGFIKQNPNNPSDPLQKVLEIEEGAVTDPIKFGDAYYILRRGTNVPKSFEDAKPELLVSLRNRRAYAAAAALAQRATERLKEVKDVAKVADEFAGEANMNKADMVRETAFVKEGDDVPNVGVSPQFEAGIAPLEEANAVGERTQIKDGFAIPMLLEKREPRDAEFDEVKEKVAAAYKLEKAKSSLEQVAKDIAANAANPEALKAAAEKAGLKASDAKDYKLDSPLGETGASSSSPALSDAIYNLKIGEVTKTPIKSGENYFVVGVKSRTEANMDEFAKQRDGLVQSALSVKKGQIFTDYLTTLRQKMEKAGSVKIYKEALTKLDGKPAEIQS